MREDIFTFLFIFILVTVLFITIAVIILRWIFRIDKIVSLLTKILSSIRQLSAQYTYYDDENDDDKELSLCECCNNTFQKSELEKIDSGQLLCSECIKNLKIRRA